MASLNSRLLATAAWPATLRAAFDVNAERFRATDGTIAFAYSL